MGKVVELWECSINNSIVENNKSDSISRWNYIRGYVVVIGPSTQSQFLAGEEKDYENTLGSQLAILPNLLKCDTIEITVKRRKE